ncbi:SDR family oxidoreductase [Mesorhizobium sp. B2-4-14]|uniref:SDR family NAD(P)-dependent oxidoreductase n=1 Tax=Mesorhizobium sp. B2-4-14 TaxID=2589935 RepID=UPI00112AB1A6|nr:SDR family oxidoreductase [Mesorhizobium sp. B2-4-14]TPK99853.1 SDR family oxidoreductase [Mesorhizobium sp. B2-4-14]
MNLAGKRALVTGASSGIGKATAETLIERGAVVALLARRGDVIDEIATRLGKSAFSVQCDVAEETSVSIAISRAWSKLGGLDIVIRAAGIITPARIENLTPQLWRQHIDINLSGAFYVMRDCGLRMRQQGSGSMVAVGSDLSFKGLACYAHYCASKAGLGGLTKALALELAPTVRVNCVCPGPVDTPMMDSELTWFGEQAREGFISGTPLKRFARPAEIARFIIFVAAEATFATGSMLSVDGGTTAR